LPTVDHKKNAEKGKPGVTDNRVHASWVENLVAIYMLPALYIYIYIYII
jgi:hypothetical protein